MQKILLLALCCSVLVSCSNTQTQKKVRDGEPDIYTVTDSDKEMNIAILTAKQTMGNFNKALEQHNEKFSGFALKEQFSTPKGGEHIWLNNITQKNNRFFGVVNNEPESTTEFKLGDTVQININNISDWMYLDNKTLRGGYTIRVLRNRMTTSEKMKFDEENNIIIEDIE